MSGIFEQPSVSAAIWPWTQGEQAPTAPLSRRPVILRGALMAGVAAGFTFLLGWPHMGTLVACAGIVMVTAGAVSPAALHGIDAALQKFGTWVGLALGWVLLVPVFVLCFIPARLVLLLKGADPMQRAFEKDKTSYWIACDKVKPKHYYRKQW